MSNHIHILVVDDNFINRQYFSMSLKKSGYQVSAVESGFAAIEVAKITNFDLILMDIRMSGMDGYETAAQVRQLLQYKNTPILATSAESIPKEHEKAFNGFLLKPISPKQLTQMVEKYCQITQITAKTFNQDSALKYAYNDKEILHKLIALFIKDLPIQMELLALNLKEANHVACRDIIHKVRGSCKTCGAEALDKQLEKLSQIIKNDNSHQTSESMHKTISEVAEFTQAMQKMT